MLFHGKNILYNTNYDKPVRASRSCDYCAWDAVATGARMRVSRLGIKRGWGVGGWGGLSGKMRSCTKFWSFPISDK